MPKFIRKSKEERMLEIRNAALDIFLEKGYSTTNMHDIVNAVEMSKGSVYRYYPSKDRIIIDLFKDAIEIRNEAIPKFDNNKIISKEEIANFLTSLLFSDLLKNKYSKLYVMFLYEKMFHKELDDIYQEFFSYNISSLNLEATLNAIEEETLLIIITMINNFILGKMILSKEFDKTITRDLIHKMILSILNK